MLRVLMVTCVVALAEQVGFATDAPPLSDSHLYPSSTVMYADVERAADLVSLIFDHPLREKIESLEPYQVAIQSPQYKQFLFGRTMVEGQLQMSWREALDTLLAHRVSIALDGDTGAIALVIQGKDAASMKLIHEKALEFAKLVSNGDRLWQGDYRGVPAFRVNELRVAVHDDRILVTNHSDLGKSVIDRLIDGGSSLADNERFQAAIQARLPDDAGWGFIDLHAIRTGDEARPVFEDQIDNPVLELMFGGIQSTIKHAPYATIMLHAQASGIGLTLATPYQADWIPEEREYFFGSSGEGRGPAIAELEETLFTLSTHRDFSEMWLRSGDLFGAQINDGFAKADANLTTLFAGRDFGEDILGSLKPEVGFIATRQSFDNVLPSPTIKLPAFAITAQLREPESMTRELRRIFQSLVGFLNVIGAMNGQSQLELDMEKLGARAELVTATYVPEEDERESTNAKINFNFSPSVGFSGDRFVIASTKSLARQLTLADQPDPPLISDNTRTSLDPHVLRDVLSDNREQLIAQNMLEDGNSRQEAEAFINLLLQVVDYFEDATVRLGQSDGQLRVELHVQVQP